MSETPSAVPGKILVGASMKDGKPQAYHYLLLALGNRHGLIAGATGGGKTVSLQRLAEGFSNAGTCVFLADVKGDLAGLSQPGEGKSAFVARAKEIGVLYEPDRFPVAFWDVFGEQGHPVRASISEMGPLLLSRLLDLNDVQEGVLNVVFRVADEQGMLLLDLKDLRAMLAHVAENAAAYKQKYGNVAPASVGAIQRQLLVLETQGGASFFGEPALDIMDFLRVDRDGRGVINILAADKLMRAPRLYATFLLWMLSELFEALPEVGDLDKPKLVFFFDEAHLLFTDAPKALLSAIEQVVRLSASISSPKIRSTCRTRFWANSATAFNMCCAHSRPAIRRRCAPPPRPFATIAPSRKLRRSCSLALAKRWCRCSTPKERPKSSNER